MRWKGRHLSWHDFSGQDLTGADLSGAFVTRSHQYGLELSDAFVQTHTCRFIRLDQPLEKVCLVQFTGTNLAGAKLVEAELFRQSTHLHAVSAWACEAGITLAQAFVGEKTNEITAIPELLEMLNLKGAVVDGPHWLSRLCRHRHPPTGLSPEVWRVHRKFNGEFVLRGKPTFGAAMLFIHKMIGQLRCSRSSGSPVNCD